MATPAEANAARVEEQGQRAVDQALRAQRLARARQVGGPGDRGAAERFASALALPTAPPASNRMVDDLRSGGFAYTPSRGPGDRGAAERPGAPTPPTAPAPAAPTPFSPSFPDDPFLNAPPGSNAMGVDLEALNYLAASGGEGEDVGGDADGGDGGGDGAPGGSGQNWATLLEQQRQEAVAMRQRLENEYQSRRDELTGMFQFAETDEERAQIAFLMAELQDATDIAYQAITDGYYQATETAILLGERARQSGNVEAAAIEDLFARSGQRVADITGRTVAESGIGAGLVGGRALQSARDFEQLLAVDAAREAALSARLGGITAEDFEMFQGRLAAQEAAQQGALARESRAAGTSLQAQHAAAVQQRIAEDRRRLAQELQELQSQYGQLGYNYDSQVLGTYGTAATLAQRDAEAAAGRAASLQLQRERANWEAQQIIDQRAYEASQRPAWQTDELAAAAFYWDTLTDVERATPGMRERIFGGILPGVEPYDPGSFLTPAQQADADRWAGRGAAESNAGLVTLTDEQILERAREIEEEEAAARRANADRIRAETAARIRESSGYSNYMRNP